MCRMPIRLIAETIESVKPALSGKCSDSIVGSPDADMTTSQFIEPLTTEVSPTNMIFVSNLKSSGNIITAAAVVTDLVTDAGVIAFFAFCEASTLPDLRSSI